MIGLNTAQHRGAGILVRDCTPTINNNLVIRNRCTSSSNGAGIYAYSGSTCNGTNNIIVQNHATNNPQVCGSINFDYSCCTQLLPGTGNITSDPMFVNVPSRGCCFLSQVAAGQNRDSPCVDTGDPSSPMVDGSTRTDGVWDTGIVDMGFHWLGEFSDLEGLFDEEFEISEIDANPVMPDLIVSNYPNPFNPATTIKLNLPLSGDLTFLVTDISGREVQTLHEGYLNSGAYEFDFVSDNLPSGIYFYEAFINGYTTTGKALLIK